ncbi:PadR family transcriptional regulator [Desulfonema magnum]|uniref:Transcriptional regulator domain-containing protein n=1 Tax=Desulfonema magnum TaxID=45655 RepID=A0A975BTP5_9BACT|nr:PadR family transcriptional regulator [Desulfonema magnum]QTA91059.1 Transcriptional regulator domain-containing protein [Desulfonema magnum]
MNDSPTVNYALLGVLMTGPRHAYEILQFMKAHLGFTWYLGRSQLYLVLKRFEKKGFLCSSLKRQDTRPSKRIFSLTPAGKQAFLDWVGSPTDHPRDTRIEFMVKLFFFHHLSLEGGCDVIDAQSQNLRHFLKKLEKMQENEEHPHKKLVLDFRITMMHEWLNWLEKEAKCFIKNIESQ